MPGPVATVAAGATTVRWTEATPVSDRYLSQAYGAAVNDGCAGVAWRSAWTRHVTTTSATVIKLVPGICYRFTLRATELGSGVSLTTTSGIVRVPGRWAGSFDIFRSSAFSTQRRYYWCVPASIQMMLNLITGASDRSWSSQYRYYTYGRPRRARLFSSLGLDPLAWQRTIERYGGGGYRIVTSSSLTNLLRYAAKRNRLTGKPVGLLVSGGGHAWVMTGFRATADPALTSDYTLTAIRTMGPLWPTQQRRHGYFDSPPGTWFSMSRMPYVYGRYRDRLGSTPWDGRYVIVTP